MFLRSSLHRPLVARRLSAPTFYRNVVRSVPPEREPEAEQRPVETPETTRPLVEEAVPLVDEPVASSSRPTSELKERMRQWADQSAIAVRTRADEFTSTTRSTLSQLGLHLNKMTGYEEIEALKRQVVEQETRILEARNAARSAKTAYDIAVVQRANSQREVNDLLQRKSNWNQADIARFTTLVPQDHTFEQEEAQARAAVHGAEEAVEREFTELMRVILARYHEEQVWSDKIRSASTYGSLTVLGLNLLVFVVAILFVEPWKRRRLALTFEKKIEEMGLEHKSVVAESMQEIGRKIEAQTLLLHSAPLATTVVDAVPVSTEALPESVADLSRRIWEKSRDPEVGATLASTAVIAGIFGWLVKSWLGS
ncbi:Mdm33 family-domain-containing protein [Mycena galopus ATCC 62051]|nr:Mdm33 family-domain-containing protein [Mycena galopus ATCC 62051]